MRSGLVAERIRVRGTVQGVGFRPHVWRVANQLGIVGSVINDSQGVLIDAIGSAAQMDSLVSLLREEAPLLARIDAIERVGVDQFSLAPSSFVIGPSEFGASATAVAADAAMCAACVAEIRDPTARRFRYPLTNCTHCGPRLSIVTGVPYDRVRTTMADWPMCAACRAEYENPADRRFHAQAIACHCCGPRVSLKRVDGRALAIDGHHVGDDCDAAGSLLARGYVLAIKGLGGYQLACDATQPAAVARLRELKRREGKPFALMVASVDAVRNWCKVDATEAEALLSPAAPVVLLQRRRDGSASPAIAAAVAPGLNTLGFMLPNTGLHHLLLRRITCPIVLTSGNFSEEPQAITLDALSRRFADGIDFVLDHERPVARRIDDSVAMVADGELRILRRARGLAPEPIALPAGFEAAAPVLAFGGELKNTVCLLRAGEAQLSQHVGDLADAPTYIDYQRALADLQAFNALKPTLLACDLHPDYLSTRLACQRAAQQANHTIAEVLHHHAHIAACLVDNGWRLDAGPVLGVVLDGLGFGLDEEGQGELWGGEFAIADYRNFDRRGTFKPVALLGGEAAMREPWRNTYAHLMAAIKWPAFAKNYAELELFDFLAGKPRDLLDAMLARRINSPLASSCGRLFDAVAAAAGICRDHAAYEGQAAVEFEATVDHQVLQFEDDSLGYPFATARSHASALPYIEPLPMWNALLRDLLLKTPLPTIAARFHKGLAKVICRMVDQLADAPDGEKPLRHVVLSGGVFQNRVVLERVSATLRAGGYSVLTHHRVPCNDGGLALGQAAVAAARALPPTRRL